MEMLYYRAGIVYSDPDQDDSFSPPPSDEPSSTPTEALEISNLDPSKCDLKADLAPEEAQDQPKA